MKSLIKTSIVVGLAIGLIDGAFGQTSQNGTWTANSGSGLWSDASKWLNGSIAGGAGSIVSYELPSLDGEYTVSLDGDRTVGELRQLGSGWTTARGFTIAGPGTLIFDVANGSPRISLSATETSNSLIRGFEITSSVQGTKGLTISGSGRRQFVSWNPTTMSLTGGITLEGAGLQVASAAALGTNTITFAGTGVNFLGFSTSGQTYANDIVLNNTTSGFMNFVGSGSITADPPTHTISGTISQVGGTRSLYYMTGTNTLGGTRFVVSGNNSYTGTTFISSSTVNSVPMNSGPIVVRAGSNNAFGTGTNAVVQILNSNSGIELSNSITISSKIARLNGEGFRGQGSINSVNGNNTWTGGVILRFGSDRGANPTIGVEEGTLTVSGVVSDGVASQGLTKVGAGTLILKGENTYVSGTTIVNGMVIADHNSALGLGAVSINGGALSVASGKVIANAISFGEDGGKLGGSGTISSATNFNNVNQVIDPGNSVGSITFGTDQSWAAFAYNWQLDDWSGTSGTFDTVNIDGNLALSASGQYQLNILSLDENGFPGLIGNFDPNSDGSWMILSANVITNFSSENWILNLAGFGNAPGSSSQWSIDQIGNNLVLNYAAVPEPAVGVLVGLGLFWILCFSGQRNRSSTARALQTQCAQKAFRIDS